MRDHSISILCDAGGSLFPEHLPVDECRNLAGTPAGVSRVDASCPTPTRLAEPSWPG
jgi:hypothetical protein